LFEPRLNDAEVAMRLMEIMTTDVQAASPSEDAEKAFQRMRTQRIRHLVVLDGRRVVGVLSERDVGGARGRALRAGKTVGELMSDQAVTASPTTTVRQAANLLRARTIGCLPIVEDGKPGIVTLTDLLELLGRQTQLSPTAGSRYTPKHGSRWSSVQRIPRPQRPPMFPR
jgi:acetoin utilization protein AcuB